MKWNQVLSSCYVFIHNHVKKSKCPMCNRMDESTDKNDTNMKCLQSRELPFFSFLNWLNEWCSIRLNIVHQTHTHMRKNTYDRLLLYIVCANVLWWSSILMRFEATEANCNTILGITCNLISLSEHSSSGVWHSGPLFHVFVWNPRFVFHLNRSRAFSMLDNEVVKI